MMTIPKTILISLAVFGDVVSLLPKSKREAWNFWFGEDNKYPQRRSYLSALEKLLKTESIEKVIEGGKVKLRITPKGLKILSTKFDLEKFTKRPWDGKWRMVVFDILESHKKQRERLRGFLKSLGFGLLQESVWISPFPIENELDEFLSQQKLAGMVLVSKAQILYGEQKELARKVWGLDRLRIQYFNLLTWWQERPPELKNKEAAHDFQKRYFELLVADPHLPNSIIGVDWPLNKIKLAYMKEVAPILQGKAA